MRSVYILVLIIFFICGCSSRIPEPVSYPYSQQKKMQASAHWKLLAADLAGRINNELILTDNILKAVYVKETCGNDSTSCKTGETSSFNEAFRDLLITNLFGFGVPVKNQPNQDAIEVGYKVQIVHHNSNRARSLQPGLLTGLSAAVAVLRNAPTEYIIMASGIAADVANTSLVDSGHYEVIITTSMTTDSRYLFRASDIYYINEKDFYHYQENMPPTKTIRLTSEQAYNRHSSTNLSPSASPTNFRKNSDTSPVD
ncbi:MAG: hypothetical protein WBB19_17970 [Desulforhopalus sp.]